MWLTYNYKLTSYHGSINLPRYVSDVQTNVDRVYKVQIHEVQSRSVKYDNKLDYLNKTITNYLSNLLFNFKFFFSHTHKSRICHIYLYYYSLYLLHTFIILSFIFHILNFLLHVQNYLFFLTRKDSMYP